MALVVAGGGGGSGTIAEYWKANCTVGCRLTSGAAKPSLSGCVPCVRGGKGWVSGGVGEGHHIEWEGRALKPDKHCLKTLVPPLTTNVSDA